MTNDQSKIVYQALREGSKTFGALCNQFNSRKYAVQVLGIKKDDLDALNTNQYKPILDRLQGQVHLAGSILSQIHVATEAHFAKEHKKDLLFRGTKSLPTHRTDGTHPIPQRQKETQLLYVEKKFYLAMQIFSKQWSGHTGIPNWLAFKINLKKRDKSMYDSLTKSIRGTERYNDKALREQQLAKIDGEKEKDRQAAWKELILSEGDWITGNSRIRYMQKGKYKWLGQVVVHYIPEPYKNIDPNVIMGIDLGYACPAAIHFNNNGHPLHWALMIGRTYTFNKTRQKTQSDIKRILHATRGRDVVLDPRAKKSLKEELKVLRKQEQRIMKTVCQTIASQIADHAKRQGAGTWVMEDLDSNIKENSPWLTRNWSPGALKDAIRWQAQQCGAELTFINPQYTSQRCSKCGHIDADNRPKKEKKQAFFRCVNCGHHENADRNAARNISTPGIEEIITEWVETNKLNTVTC